MYEVLMAQAREIENHSKNLDSEIQRMQEKHVNETKVSKQQQQLLLFSV